MKSRWEHHRGVQILYVDFSGFGEDLDGLQAELEAVSSIVVRQPEGSVLGLVDIRGTTLTSDATIVLKDSAPTVGRHIRKAAVVTGRVTGFRRVILDAVTRVAGRQATPFDDVEEARDWLVTDRS